ncbi:uncharacterized protein N7459_001977 [Penicillium hispanicum]|uniref:uncharacterized protein n=1 Tax=Penicillium hispanicum TaxID=1080232 RepID=UPI00254008D1|nr:uncharacterized protein N7459_001977 [Penicillium hispanicum]KAJ5591608.1 hypothetical protein N7459_001977 [Penicillium hispanicum]
MNNHLLPFPYNQSSRPTWLQRAVQPLSDLLWRRPAQHASPNPSTTAIPLPPPNDGNTLAPVRIICISDTHNATPPLPPGDILIHAGDLTVHGTFAEVQAQLRWLSSQPHTHKVVIAGNHDILLDASNAGVLALADNVPGRHALDWGGIRYLQDEAVAVDLPMPGLETRRVKIYGSPLTPECGRWAFQYPAIRDVWTGRVPDDTDILVVHGPPALYGDCDGEMGPTGRVKVKGDGYLLREIRRVKPKMVVCGHIHGAYGTAVMRHDGNQDVEDGLQMRWEGYDLFGVLKQIFRNRKTPGNDGDGPAETLVVNAAVAPSAVESEGKSPITVDFH